MLLLMIGDLGVLTAPAFFIHTFFSIVCLTVNESPLAGYHRNSKSELLCTESVWTDVNTHTTCDCLNFMTPCSSLGHGYKFFWRTVLPTCSG